MEAECVAIAKITSTVRTRRSICRWAVWLAPLFWFLPMHVRGIPGYGTVRLRGAWKWRLVREARKVLKARGNFPDPPDPADTLIHLARTPERQARLRGYLDGLPSPHYRLVPGQLDLYIRTNDTGRDTFGRCTEGTFVPLDRDTARAVGRTLWRRKRERP